MANAVKQGNKYIHLNVQIKKALSGNNLPEGPEKKNIYKLFGKLNIT